MSLNCFTMTLSSKDAIDDYDDKIIIYFRCMVFDFISVVLACV